MGFYTLKSHGPQGAAGLKTMNQLVVIPGKTQRVMTKVLTGVAAKRIEGTC